MNLGLGLALELQNGKFGSIYDGLIKSGATMILDPNRADGKKPGTNSPFVNPLVDLANKVGKNLFDVLTMLNNQGVVASNGANSSDASSNSSDFISVKPGQDYTISNCRSIGSGTFGLAFYDKDKNFLFGENYNGSIYITPQAPNVYIKPILENVAFLRFTIRDRNILNGTTTQLEIGSTATTYEPFAKNNALLQNFIPSSADGYATIIAPNGKTVTVLNLDGSNSFGALASSDALNPIGTGDFVIADVIRTNSLKDQYLITKATSSEATTQYGVKITSTGNLVLILEGTSITLATGLLANTLYKILISRDNGTLRCELQGVQTYSQANTISLIAKANTLIGALSTIAGGTTQTGYANVSQGIKVFGKDHDFAKFKSEFYKLVLKQFGL
jgi:hypothetical protein